MRGRRPVRRGNTVPPAAGPFSAEAPGPVLAGPRPLLRSRALAAPSRPLQPLLGPGEQAQAGAGDLHPARSAERDGLQPQEILEGLP